MGHTSIGPTLRNPDAPSFDGDDTADAPVPVGHAAARGPGSARSSKRPRRTTMPDPDQRFEDELWRWYRQQSVIYDPDAGVTVGNYRSPS